MSLLKSQPGVRVTLSGRDPVNFERVRERRQELSGCDFKPCDVEDPSTLQRLLAGDSYDLVIHTAGPFQRRKAPNVLEACINSGTPYLDVCDDVEYCKGAKRLHERARERGVPCITTGGIFPGVSNLMVAHIASIVGKEYDPKGEWGAEPDLFGRGDGPHDSLSPPPPLPSATGNPLPAEEVGTGGKAKRVLLSYYTAGTGGAGPTILASTFLLAGEEVGPRRTRISAACLPAAA